MNIVETLAKTEEQFIQIALSYGKLIPSRKNNNLIDILKAKRSEDVEYDSLSKRFGLNQFPIHTDGAYLKTPPKYILLRYVGELKKVSPTTIIKFDFQKLEEGEFDFIKNTVWFVKGADGGFYSTILNKSFIRYDLQVMKIVNALENKMTNILKKMPKREINWQPNKVVVINNWETLHSRPNLRHFEEGKRILQRINVL